MIVKTFARGIGAGRGPVDYCISTFVAVVDPTTKKKTGEYKERIPPPVIMRGNPNLAIALIDSSENKWKYTSGVIAFADSDAPSVDQQNAVIDSFEAMAFAGLDPDQFSCLWVKHEHEGNVELHFVTPRLELSTSKALNIAPPGHSKTFDVWRDSQNYSRGWASPNEPERKRPVARDDDDLKNDAARLKAGLQLSDDPKRLLTDHLLARDVQNRADVLSELQELGLEINRKGPDYISVRIAPGAKPIRLKGPLYESTYQAANAKPTIRYRNEVDDKKRAKAASLELARIIEARSQFNRKRYKHPDITPIPRTYERAKPSVIPSADSAQNTAPAPNGAFERASSKLDRAGSDLELCISTTATTTQRASSKLERSRVETGSAIKRYDEELRTIGPAHADFLEGARFSSKKSRTLGSAIGLAIQVFDEFKRRIEQLLSPRTTPQELDMSIAPPTQADYEIERYVTARRADDRHFQPSQTELKALDRIIVQQARVRLAAEAAAKPQTLEERLRAKITPVEAETTPTFRRPGR